MHDYILTEGGGSSSLLLLFLSRCFYNPFASRFFVCEYLYYIYTVGQILDIYMLIVKRQGVYFPGKVYGVYSNYIALGSIDFIFCIGRIQLCRLFVFFDSCISVFQVFESIE